MFDLTHRTLICTLWTICLSSLLFFASVEALGQCCDSSAGINDTDTEWTVVMNYAHFGTPNYGDNNTTHCQCRQACLNQPDCVSYDWYPHGNSTRCWTGNICPVKLTQDANNQHYLKKSKLSCYSNFTEVSWKLVMNYAHFGTPNYGDNNTTHCQCRQACLDQPGCVSYDWYPHGNSTRCWTGNKCPVKLTQDANNQHYILASKLDCYPPNLTGAAQSALSATDIIVKFFFVGILLIKNDILVVTTF